MKPAKTRFHLCDDLRLHLCEAGENEIPSLLRFAKPITICEAGENEIPSLFVVCEAGENEIPSLFVVCEAGENEIPSLLRFVKTSL